MTNEEQEAPPIVLWAIYEKPDDYRDGYVLRRWLVSGESVQPGASSRHATLPEARAGLPPGAQRVPASAPETGIPVDPKIIEVWL